MRYQIRIMSLLLATAALSACAVVQQIVEKPSVHVLDAKYESISLEEGRLDANLQLGNPNGFGLPLKKMHYTLRLNDKQLASSTVSFDRSIPAHGSTRIHVPIRFQYRALLNGLGSLLQSRNVHYQLTGQLDFGLVTVAFSKSGEFVLRL
jgi:LEA14-like dessication related protein